MRTKIRTKFANVAATMVATFSFVIVLMAVVAVDSARADDEPACSDVEVVFARGSGQGLGAGEAKRFSNQIENGAKSPLTHNFYELGTKKQNNYQYPAVNVSDVRNGNAMGAWISRGNANDYGKSVNQGVYEAIYYMNSRYVKCKSAGSKFIIAGYSQGAQVIGEYVRAAPAEVKASIVFVALFGDPKLHLPEGEGFNPPACRGEQLSAYRRVIANCDVDNGSLGARKPYLPDDMKNKTGLWCYANDFICGSSKLAWDAEGHGKYGLEGNAIDSAVYEALQKVRASLPTEQQQYIPTKRSTGDGTTGLDVMIVIDTTGSMGGRIEQAKQFAAASAARIQALRGRVALVSYRDAGDSYTARIERPLSSDMTDFTTKLNSLTVDGGGDTPEATLHALMTGMNGLSWKNGATKATILLTDASFHNPDMVDGTTLDQVVKRALEIDPVNIYPVVPSWEVGNYHELAERTNGQVIEDTGNTEEALFAALTKIEQRPTALLKNQEYRADVNQQVTFDASDSYVDDGMITGYDWDFDGDGVYERHTTEPVAKHIYTERFDGVMQVRLTASNGTIASASVTVKIGTYVAPVAPSAPKNLAIIKDNGSSVVIGWQPADDSTIDSWIISSDGIALGKVAADTTSVTITDMYRDNDLPIEVTGLLADGTIGESASVIAPAQPVATVPAAATIRQVVSESNSEIPLWVASVTGDNAIITEPAKHDIIADFTKPDTLGATAVRTSSHASWYGWLIAVVGVATIVVTAWLIVTTKTRRS